MPEIFNGVIVLDPSAIAIVMLRTFVVYVALLLGLRVAGKRELGQMTTFDLVVVLIISNAVQNAMVGDDTSLSSGLFAAFTLLGLNALVTRLGIRWPWLANEITGTPTVLISEGKFIQTHLKREGVSVDEVLMALREHGVEKPEDVDLAVLEVNGSISVISQGEGPRRTRRIPKRRGLG